MTDSAFGTRHMTPDAYQLPSLAVIVLTSIDGRKDVAECLSSLERQTDRDFQLVVVDNASTDDTVEFLQRNFPSVRTIVNDGNLGYSGGMQRGIDATHGDVVWLLNNDTVLMEDAVTQLRNAWARQASNVAALFPCVRYYAEPTLVQTFGCVWRPDGRWISRPAPLDRISTVFGDMFVAPSFRRLLLEQAGSLGYGFTNGAEDFDMSYRLNFLGFDLRAAPQIRVSHKVSRTVARMPRPERERYSILLHLRILIRYYTLRNVLVYLPRAFVRVWFYRGLIASIRRHEAPIDIIRYFEIPLRLVLGFKELMRDRRYWQHRRERIDRAIWETPAADGSTSLQTLR